MEASSHLRTWASAVDEASHVDFPGHVRAIAHGRFVLRQATRILDEEAVAGGLQPLSHQALLQIYAAQEPISMSKLADRLSIPSALASRIIRKLELDGLVERSGISDDRRVVVVAVTPVGEQHLREIDQAVHLALRAFHATLDDDDKLGALATFASYVGLDADPRLGPLFASSAAPRPGSRKGPKREG